MGSRHTSKPSASYIRRKPAPWRVTCIPLMSTAPCLTRSALISSRFAASHAISASSEPSAPARSSTFGHSGNSASR